MNMIYNIKGDTVRLVQVTDTITNEPLGLYLVPISVSNEELEDNIAHVSSQDDFDNENDLGIERVIIEEIYGTF